MLKYKEQYINSYITIPHAKITYFTGVTTQEDMQYLFNTGHQYLFEEVETPVKKKKVLVELDNTISE